MKDFKDRLTSRKFLMAIGAIVGYLLFAFAGQVDLAAALEGIKQVVLAYFVVEGAGDVAGRFKPNGP